MLDNKCGYFVLSVISLLFLGVYFSVAEAFGSSNFSQAIGLIGGALICLMAFAALYVMKKINMNETYLYPTIIAGLYACFIPMLDESASVYNDTHIHFPVSLWSSGWFHSLVLLGIVFLGYGMILCIIKNK
ncbi:hypothetical protein GBN23_02845 [Plesiomonas shigelloides]|uniref:hypothetical protein n=1 Tax=Plesiomonas shigelloides TaxID=703 RepID=UPI001262296D|nr:hypothetical protein [Plesiomonas shigelloides]KAB7684427.1 hypothetical protein GBN23_02845 [Plesiomonas shigelloides]